MQLTGMHLIDPETRETAVTSSDFARFVDRSLLNAKVDAIVLLQRQDDRVGTRLVDTIAPSVDHFVVVFHQSNPAQNFI